MPNSTYIWKLLSRIFCEAWYFSQICQRSWAYCSLQRRVNSVNCLFKKVIFHLRRHRRPLNKSPLYLVWINWQNMLLLTVSSCISCFLYPTMLSLNSLDLLLWNVWPRSITIRFSKTWGYVQISCPVLHTNQQKIWKRFFWFPFQKKTFPWRFMLFSLDSHL